MVQQILIRACEYNIYGSQKFKSKCLNDFQIKPIVKISYLTNKITRIIKFRFVKKISSDQVTLRCQIIQKEYSEIFFANKYGSLNI